MIRSPGRITYIRASPDHHTATATAVMRSPWWPAPRLSAPDGPPRAASSSRASSAAQGQPSPSVYTPPVWSLQERDRTPAGPEVAPAPRPRSRAPASAAKGHPWNSPSGRGSASGGLARRPERVPAAGLLHPAGHREPDQGVHHVLPVMPPGQRLDDGGLGARYAVREQREDGRRDPGHRGVDRLRAGALVGRGGSLSRGMRARRWGSLLSGKTGDPGSGCATVGG